MEVLIDWDSITEDIQTKVNLESRPQKKKHWWRLAKAKAKKIIGTIYIIFAKNKTFPSTIHITNTFPNTLQVLLPESNLPISTAYGQQIASQTPWNTPNNVRELASRWGGRGSPYRWRCRSSRRIQGSFYPRRSRRVFRPNNHSFVLRSCGDITARQPNTGGPSYISNPISVTF